MSSTTRQAVEECRGVVLALLHPAYSGHAEVRLVKLAKAEALYLIDQAPVGCGPLFGRVCLDVLLIPNCYGVTP